MKKMLAVILSAAMLCAGVFAFSACGGDNGKPTLTMYTNAAFAPYEYLNADGKVVGVDVDIVREIGEVLGYNIEIRDVAFGSIFDNVQNDVNAIGLAGITITEERKASGIFSIEYATSVQYAIIPEAWNVDANLTEGKLKISALEGKKIGTQESTTGYFLIDEAVNGYEDDDGNKVTGDLEGKNSQVISYSNGILAGNNLGGQIDCIVIDELPAKSIAQGKTGYVTVALDAEPESYGIYFNKNATELRDQIDKVLKALIDNGVIEYLTLKHSGAII